MVTRKSFAQCAKVTLAVYKASSGLEWVGVQGLSGGCWLTPAGHILVTTLTYPFGESCGSIVGSGCLFKLVQLRPIFASILCKPLQGLGGDGVIMLNTIVLVANRNKNVQRKPMCNRMLVYIVCGWISVQLWLGQLGKSHLLIYHLNRSCMYVLCTIRNDQKPHKRMCSWGIRVCFAYTT